MKITQISVFLENKQGRLREVCSVLGKERINIRALTIAESEQFGIARMVVDRHEDAIRVLKEQGFVAQLTDIVALEVDDSPGGLAHILQTLDDEKVNVEYMYGFVEKHSNKALMVFRFDDTDRALQVLREKGISVVGKKDIGAL